MTKSSFCSYCGTKFENDAWPRSCGHCGNMTFRNPLPVACLVVPIGMRAVLTVRRGIEPGLGGLALPGGYIEFGEDWKSAASREAWEETQLVIDPKDIHLLDVGLSSNGSSLLVFGWTEGLHTLPPFTPNKEVTELVAAGLETELVFPTHMQAKARVLKMLEGARLDNQRRDIDLW